MKNNSMKGHIAAFVTIFLWGTTYVSTKILLVDFQPIEILFYRFCIGLAALYLISPKKMEKTKPRQELTFAAAGLCGITLYFLFENIALTYTSASNVGVIISLAPFFTGILASWWLDGEKPNKNFFIGFLAAISGIGLISYNGSAVLHFNPMGDFLALAAALIWAVYSILSRKISQFGCNTVHTTRRVFSYGLLLMLPIVAVSRFTWAPERFMKPVNLFNILFLGLGASALCFVTWNLAVKALGAVKTSIYIYMVPVITVVTSVLLLGERITWMSAAGTLLTLTGLFISEKREVKRSSLDNPDRTE